MCKTDEPVLKRRKTSEIDENGLKHEKTDENVYKTKKTYENGRNRLETTKTDENAQGSGYRAVHEMFT